MAQQPYAKVAFTSELRRRLLVSDPTNRAGQGGVLFDATAQNNSTPEASVRVDMVDTGGSPSVLQVVELPLNPRSVAFDQPKRFVKKDTRTGSVFFHFTDPDGRNQDLLTLTFEASTGNIDPRTAEGLENHLRWLNLYAMSREPVRLLDGSENVIRCAFSSRAMPFPVDFSGFFKSVVKFTETGARPNSFDYTFEFQVTAAPALDEVLSAFDRFLSETP